jgi:hypothetical protein
MRNSSSWVAFINILFMMPYLVISVGQGEGKAGYRRRGRAGDANKDLAWHCAARHEAYGIFKGPIKTDPTAWKTYHFYPAAKPLWRQPVCRARCQVKLGLALCEAEKK